MKKIVLATPPLSLQERYGALAGAGNTMPCLGLLSLAGMAREKGFDVSLVEASSLGLSLDEVVKEILSASPDYVGLTSTTLSICSASALAEKAKSGQSRLKVIVGGPHLTALPSETLQAFPAFDYGVIGEGEAT
ncbi:MAG TPA: cobalamin B12-binding domain-containing protein, partial [Thermodesulfobacteriota bacterium]|nr:cobalamin B12-binding domain-containing protein [Thermodesulfobacteriota bacterium]